MAIAVDDRVPQITAILRATVESLLGVGAECDSVQIVAAGAELAEACRADIAAARAKVVEVVVHDPDDERVLCFVGLDRRGEPVVVNRALFEADVVLAIGRAQPHASAYSGLFPQFSATAAIERLRTPAHIDSPEHRRRQRRETDDAGRMIGVALLVQVVPGPGDSVAHVVAGEPRHAAKAAQRLYQRRWSKCSPRKSSLVVATVTGGPLEQSWSSVADALVAAGQLVDEDGAVAICTNLNRPLGESLSRLVGGNSAEAIGRKVFHEHADDSWAAWQMARALARGPVYLLSGLDAELVEDMGLAPVESIEDLVRLASRHESCIVLEDAQHVIAEVEGEAPDA